MYKLTEKQKEVIRCYRDEKPNIILLSGAKRAGKTFTADLIYLDHISKFRGKQFILGGNTHASIWRNVLEDWQQILGVTFKEHKDNSIDVFGNKVYLFGGSDCKSYESVRGFTAYGAFLNEATTLHERFVKECITRCSGTGAKIFMDTNPENPLHFVKTDYFDKSPQYLNNGQLNIISFDFKLTDNTALDPVYVESIKASTPSGVFYDRDILGLWVNAEGVVYKDFNADKHIIHKKDLPHINNNLAMVRVFAGVDWGFGHKGAIVVAGIDKDNKVYVLEEYTKEGLLIDDWVRKAKEFIERYGKITFYADPARTEHIVRFRKENIKCLLANNNVRGGIETVSKLLVQDRLLLVKENMMDLPKEFSLYVWGKDEQPLKINDDAIDALRYAVYSDYLNNKDVYFPLLTEKPKNYRPKYYR